MYKPKKTESLKISSKAAWDRLFDVNDRAASKKTKKVKKTYKEAKEISATALEKMLQKSQ